MLITIFENEYLTAIDRRDISDNFFDRYLVKFKDLYPNCNVFIQPKEILPNGKIEFRWYTAKGESLTDFIQNHLNNEIQFIKSINNSRHNIKE
ncbi:hypothetical protein F3667_01735 [Campylobacter coli]|uniref:hypothetical protein n=1 Tax=Campylobacter coli TaxID=195 RepID=UPI000707AC51|nr:hypothetical protein [Campylobacter coli]ECW7644259.1 hypothetical protein [Campylobacter coli]KQH22724.1 hypothetical protein UD08_00200 [Campylobacter coli]